MLNINYDITPEAEMLHALQDYFLSAEPYWSNENKRFQSIIGLVEGGCYTAEKEDDKVTLDYGEHRFTLPVGYTLEQHVLELWAVVLGDDARAKQLMKDFIHVLHNGI